MERRRTAINGRRIKSGPRPDRLTTKQKLFVEEYIKSGDMWSAYRAAGYTGNVHCCERAFYTKKVQQAIRFGLRTEWEEYGANTESKFNQERANIILSAVRDGLPRKRAAQLAGVNYQSLRRWVKKGEEFFIAGEVGHPIAVFAREYRRNFVEGELSNLRNIKEQAFGREEVVEREITTLANGDIIEKEKIKKTNPKWQPSAWILERVYGYTRENANTDQGSSAEEQAREFKQALDMMFQFDTGDGDTVGADELHQIGFFEGEDDSGLKDDDVDIDEASDYEELEVETAEVNRV